MKNMKVNKEFIPYEQALALKELGFNEPCFGYYYTTNGKDWKFAEKAEFYRLDDEMNIGGKFSLLAPTYSQVFKWLRNNQNLYADIFVDDNKTFGFMITYFTSEGRVDKPIKYNHITYEEAELACLRKLINICKKK